MRNPTAAVLALLLTSTGSLASAQGPALLRQAEECRSSCWREHFPPGSAQPAHNPDCTDQREFEQWARWCHTYDAIGRCSAACDQPVREAIARERRAEAERYEREQAELMRRLEEARRQHQEAIDRIARAEREQQLRREGRGAPRVGERRRCDPWRDLAGCEQACAAGDGQACVAAAIAYLGHHDGTESRDPDRATELFRRGCEAGSARGCSAMSSRADTRDEARALYARALGLAELGCQRDDGDDCVLLGRLQYSSYEWGQPVPYPQVEQTFRRGCDLGSIESCYMVMHYPLINGFIRRDHGMPADTGTLVARIYDLAERSCSGDTSPSMDDCMPLAALLAGYFTRPGSGIDVTRLPREHRRANPSRALQIWDESCRNGFEWACRSANHVRWLQQQGMRQDW